MYPSSVTLNRAYGNTGGALADHSWTARLSTITIFLAPTAYWAGMLFLLTTLS